MSVSNEPDDDFKTRYPDHVYPAATAAVRFLTEIANRGDMTIVCIATDDSPPRTKTFDTADSASVEEMRSFIAFHETQAYQVFYVANSAGLQCHNVPTREDIQTIRLLVFDVDPDKTKPLEEERDRMRRLAYDLCTGPLQPRAIIDTGGGMQVVYQLLEPMRATEDTILVVEHLMKAVARALGADTATCTVKNLFRVPGTYNWPTPAKKAVGRERTVAGIWHFGGPRCSLEDLAALATVRLEDETPSAPVQFDDLTEHDLLAVLSDPEALPAAIKDRLRDDPVLLDNVKRPPPIGDTSKGDFTLCCMLHRFRFRPREIALILAAYGHKTETVFKQERLFSYVVQTVEAAVRQTRVDNLLGDFEDEAKTQEEQKRKAEHRARLKPLNLDEALTDLFTEDQQSLVQGMIGQAELVVVYGRPGSGKTFTALDLGFHIAQGRDWNQRTVRQSAVVYIAAESPRGVRYRLKALFDRYGATDLFFLVPTTVNMFDPRVDLKPLMDEIANLNVPVGMIVIDTLARTMIGGNENSTEDMSRLVSNGDILRDRFHASIVWVHHSGKNEAAGARGSSALQAATDTEIEVSDCTFRSTKMRDREDVDYRFRLHPVQVGAMPDGEIITSCTVNWVNDPGTFGQNTPESNNLKMIVEILRARAEMLTFREILAEAELVGRKFTVRQNSLQRALDRECDSDVRNIFTRETTQQKSKNGKLIVKYGLVNW